jgi:hypothetical protein
MQKIDDCKEIRLALTRAGIATCPEKCLQTFRLVVTAQYIYHNLHVNKGVGDVVDAVVRDGGRVRLERVHVASRGREGDVRRVVALPS